VAMHVEHPQQRHDDNRYGDTDTRTRVQLIPVTRWNKLFLVHWI
jgi:hypothetical protein